MTKKGGHGPNEGKIAFEYVIRLNGITYRKRMMLQPGFEAAPEMIATGFMHLGQPKFALWPINTEPAWEGAFGRLPAILEKKR